MEWLPVRYAMMRVSDLLNGENAVTRQSLRQAAEIFEKLKADMGRRGILEPIQVELMLSGKIYIHNGAHRILAASELGIAEVLARIIAPVLLPKRTQENCEILGFVPHISFAQNHCV